MEEKKNKRNIDIISLNNILKTGSKLINIGYIMAIFALIIFITYIVKEWKILVFLKELIIVISPIFIGILIAWLLDPLVRRLTKKKLPRIVGCIIAYVILIGIILLICYLLIPSLISQIKDFAVSAPHIFDELTDFITHFISKFDTNNYINTKHLKKEMTTSVNTFLEGVTSDLPKYAISIGKSIVNGGVNFALGLMIGFYLLYDFNKINKKIKRFLPVTWRDNYDELTHRINTSLRNYVQGVLIVMLLVFLTQSVGLTLAGMSAPLVFAMFCAITDVIPYFGPYIGGIPAVIVGFTISPITGICVLISIVIVQILENNFYQPLIMGHTMSLHPVTIMLGLLVFGHFFGIIGMVTATPVIAIIKVLLQFINEKLNVLNKITGENS